MIRFNIPCTIERRDGTDGYGQEVISAPARAYCQVVKLEKTVQHSTIRTDASGSRGGADEARADAVLLLSPAAVLDIEDLITVNSIRVRVIGIRSRYAVTGRLDHYEVSGEVA